MSLKETYFTIQPSRIYAYFQTEYVSTHVSSLKRIGQCGRECADEEILPKGMEITISLLELEINMNLWNKESNKIRICCGYKSILLL